MEASQSVVQYLVQEKVHYLTKAQLQVEENTLKDLDDKSIVLYRIDEVTYDEKAPRKEALENVLSAVRIPGVHFLYLLVGNKEKVQFYYGLSADPNTLNASRLSIKEMGDNILKSSIQGNFRGCKVVAVEPSAKENILDRMRQLKYAAQIDGVAGTIKDNEEFQSVDRLVNVMQGEEYCLLLVAKAVSEAGVCAIEASLQDAYSAISSASKYSQQLGSSESTNKSLTSAKGESSSQSTSKSHSEGTNSSKTSGKNHSESKSKTKGESHTKGSSSDSKGDNSSTTTGQTGGESSSESCGENRSTQQGSSESKGESFTQSKQEGTTQGTSDSITREYVDKGAVDWVKYCEDVVFPKLDYGRGKGLFLAGMYIMADKQTALIKLENTILALYSGKQGNRVPLRSNKLGKQDGGLRKSICLGQLPRVRFGTTITEEEQQARLLCCQCVEREGAFCLGNWLTTNELSMLAGLPQKEVIGMRLREEVAFGLNYQQPVLTQERIPLGVLVQDGNEVPTTQVYLDKNVLDKHLFIAGVTGSGKTTTCQRILLQSNLPFLVIEPAKTEYRILQAEKDCEELVIFTLGNDSVAPFRLNPLEFLPHESITSHVDMLKASIEAAFDMEAAIPQLIETIIYRCYEEKGWNVTTNRNEKYIDPFAADVCAFPTLTDLLGNIDKVVQEQHFDERLRNDYIGSIRARLQSLVLGAKGLMLDTKRSLDFTSLLDKKVVLELENIKNGNEKALIMGFILSAFNEAVRERYIRERKSSKHIILIEEAHRLLSKFIPGDSLNKKQGVEIFCDMLAEIRKYGESLIIADQIPNKLTSDVLKNTNTKLIHRIFAQDDKEAVGNTMALTAEQKEYLSNLETGRAVMFSDNFGQALLVQIKQQTDTNKAPVEDKQLFAPAYAYYTKYCRGKIFLPLAQELSNLNPAQQKRVGEYLRIDVPDKMLAHYRKKSAREKWNKYYAQETEYLLREKIVTMEGIVSWIWARNFARVRTQADSKLLTQWLEAYLKGEAALKALDVRMLF